MGVLGSAGLGFLGSLAGKRLEKYLGSESAGESAGGTAGAYLGAMLPYKKGGVVGRGRRRGSPVPILAHAGEYILPVGVKPTLAQKKKVAKLKKK